MKIGILTFFFAHNYGAVLQAYALKTYLEETGHNASLIDFIPETMKSAYSLNPFSNRGDLKDIVKKICLLPKKTKQFKLFQEFIKPLIEKKHDREYEAVICGSDQIWNDSITGEIADYYLPKMEKNVLRISYAASFGKKQLSEFQEHCINEYVSKFNYLSLREEDGVDSIERITSITPSIVVDPVFLLSVEKWANLAMNTQNNIQQQFILYYSLKNTTGLKEKAERLSFQTGLKIIVIHPTCVKQNVEGEQLYNVGPFEFLSLIKNAEFVCTDSFHATAFSIIFGKKYIHMQSSKQESRVESLLNRAGAYSACEREINNIVFLDLSFCNKEMLNANINNSKEFLNCALNTRGDRK